MRTWPALGLDQPLYGLQARGLYREDQTHTTVEDMAAHYVEAVRNFQPDGPYHLGGWSLGGAVAFEMARQLREQGCDVGLLALLDPRTPGMDGESEEVDETLLMLHFAEDRGLPLPEVINAALHMQQLPAGERLGYLLEQVRKANILGTDVPMERVHQLAHVFMTNLVAVRKYNPPVYPGPATLFRASDGPPADPPVPTDLGWGRLAAGGVKIIDVPGDHASMVKEPDVRVLAERLTECLSHTAETP